MKTSYTRLSLKKTSLFSQVQDFIVGFVVFC